MTDETPAISAVAASGVPYTVVRTERASSAEESAAFQGIPVGALLRTIVVRRGDDDYVFVLVPAGRRFDWPRLREHLGVRRLTLPDAEEAREVTGYERYTITPFGSTRAWPVIVDARRCRTRSWPSVVVASGSICTWRRTTSSRPSGRAVADVSTADEGARPSA